MVEILSRSGIRVCWNWPGKSVKSETKSESSSCSIQLGWICFLVGFCVFSVFWVGFLSTRFWGGFVVVGLVVLFLGELSLARSEVFLEVSELGLVEFEGLDVELSFLRAILMVGGDDDLVELVVDLMSLVWLLEDKLGLSSLVWFLEERLGLMSLVWFLEDWVVEVVVLVLIFLGWTCSSSSSSNSNIFLDPKNCDEL